MSLALPTPPHLTDCHITFFRLGARQDQNAKKCKKNAIGCLIVLSPIPTTASPPSRRGLKRKTHNPSVVKIPSTPHVSSHTSYPDQVAVVRREESYLNTKYPYKVLRRTQRAAALVADAGPERELCTRQEAR